MRGGVGDRFYFMRVFKPPTTFKIFDLDTLFVLRYSIYMETAQNISSRLKQADNKVLWAFAQELYTSNHRLEKITKKLQDRKASVDLNDKEGLRQTVIEHLFAESAKGNAQASDKLARLAGLGETEQDIVIEVVNYEDTCNTKK